MQKLFMLSLLLYVSASACFAKSAVGDWQAVQQDIPTGWQMIVVTSMTFPCIYESANDYELVCKRLDRANANEAEIHIRRERIHEVRVEKRQGPNMLAGGAAGAGLGSVLGALLIPDARGTRAYALGLGGASLGVRTGRDTHILRAKVIYRRP
jgi:hypothetical protein